MKALNNNKVHINLAPTLLYGGNTGIQRVVLELEHYLDGQQVAGFEYEFGGLFGGHWVKAGTFRATYRGPSPNESRVRYWLSRYLPYRVRSAGRRFLTRLHGQQLQGDKLPAGSIVIDVDAGWIDEWSINYGLDLRRITLVYDLIPYSHPQFCTPEHNENFQRWLQATVLSTDACISISKSAMEACEVYVQGKPGARMERYGYFHLGCDFSLPKGGADVALPQALRLGRYFLIVGSIEPRKNHRLAIEAFDSYRKTGGDWDLVIVGRAGWSCDEIFATMTASDHYGQSLQWFGKADDALLARLYRDAGALVIPSHIEGFGLPLVEAAHWGRSVIASDIPVFREIGEDFANFFVPTDATQLETRMWEAERGKLAKHLAPGKAVALSWQQSAMQFAKEVARLLKEQRP